MPGPLQKLLLNPPPISILYNGFAYFTSTAGLDWCWAACSRSVRMGSFAVAWWFAGVAWPGEETGEAKTSVWSASASSGWMPLGSLSCPFRVVLAFFVVRLGLEHCAEEPGVSVFALRFDVLQGCLALSTCECDVPRLLRLLFALHRRDCNFVPSLSGADNWLVSVFFEGLRGLGI
ncbi:hypothetical protein KC349_g308 [Hortaea werneckii]|nr:hypothetical protein KC349_g308 [Hortaea werneckii]